MSRIIPELSGRQIWFLTGIQHLYGPEIRLQVAEQSQQIAKTLDESDDILVTVRRLASTPPPMLPSAIPTAWAPRNAHFVVR
jgi:L-arabinose isomerase